MNGSIWLGDVLRALQATGTWDTPERTRVAELLGYSVPGASPPMAEATAPSVPEQASGDREERGPKRRPEAAPSPRADVTPGDLRPSGGAGFPMLTPALSARAPSLAAGAGESLPQPGDRNRSPVIRYQPLFQPRTERAILQAALSRRVAEGPIDTAALVTVMARCQPVRVVPRRKVRTLRYGVQVLIDLGPGMEPFRRDQEYLAGQIIRTVGRDKVSVKYFAYSPLRGSGPGPGWTWLQPYQPAYQPPARGTPILLLADLGIGGPRGDFRKSTRPEWLRFAATAARNESAVVALLVHPAERWPAWLTSVMSAVHWDRRTTARMALTALAGQTPRPPQPGLPWTP